MFNDPTFVNIIDEVFQRRQNVTILYAHVKTVVIDPEDPKRDLLVTVRIQGARARLYVPARLYQALPIRRGDRLLVVGWPVYSPPEMAYRVHWYNRRRVR